MYVWMDGWMDGWMYVCMCLCMYLCMYTPKLPLVYSLKLIMVISFIFCAKLCQVLACQTFISKALTF